MKNPLGLNDRERFVFNSERASLNLFGFLVMAPALGLVFLFVAGAIVFFGTAPLSGCMYDRELGVFAPSSISVNPFTALLIAPWLENVVLVGLLLAADRWLTTSYFALPVIFGLALLAHGGGCAAQTPAFLFVFMGLMFVWRRRSLGSVRAYWETVISHFTANAVIIIF